MNIAFTLAGLLKLGAPKEFRERFSDAFVDRMRERRDLLADPPQEEWGDDNWQSHEANIHVCLMLHDKPTDAEGAGAPDTFAHLIDELPGRGFQELFTETGQRLPSPPAYGSEPDGAYGHFGYLDGISQPWVAGVRQEDDRGSRLGHFEAGDWRPIAAGEFLFGYESEGGETPPITRAHLRGAEHTKANDAFRQFVRNGTYMVWRKLEQHVKQFDEFVGEHASLFAPDADSERAREFFKAKMVGRWPDGTPLQSAPTAESSPSVGAGLGPERNDFTYAEDKSGELVPLGAHIRRASPRAPEPNVASLTKRRHIIRRGIPYGPAPWGSSSTAAGPRGLIFVALNTNIAGQFELIQREWMNHGDFARQGADRDPLAGRRVPDYDQQFVIQGSEGPYVARSLPDFVTFRGGAYFFVPGIRAIEQIATGFGVAVNATAS
jgi:Dyp-type peroxidase family